MACRALTQTTLSTIRVPTSACVTNERHAGVMSTTRYEKTQRTPSLGFPDAHSGLQISSRHSFDLPLKHVDDLLDGANANPVRRCRLDSKCLLQARHK